MALGEFIGKDTEEGRFGTAIWECCAITRVGLPSEERDIGSSTRSELRVSSVLIILLLASVAK